MDEKQKKQLIIMGIVVATLGILYGIYWGVNKWRTEMKMTRTELESVSKKNSIAEKNFKAHPGLKEEVKALRQELREKCEKRHVLRPVFQGTEFYLKNAKEVVVASSDAASIEEAAVTVTEPGSLAKGHLITVPKLQKDVEEDKFRVYQANLRISHDYRKLGPFLADLEENNPYIVVKDMKLRSTKENMEQDLRLTLLWPIFDDPEAARETWIELGEDDELLADGAGDKASEDDK